MHLPGEMVIAAGADAFKLITHGWEFINLENCEWEWRATSERRSLAAKHVKTYIEASGALFTQCTVCPRHSKIIQHTLFVVCVAPDQMQPHGTFKLKEGSSRWSWTRRGRFLLLQDSIYFTLYEHKFDMHCVFHSENLVTPKDVAGDRNQQRKSSHDLHTRKIINFHWLSIISWIITFT